jgi:hypothetical protein
MPLRTLRLLRWLTRIVPIRVLFTGLSGVLVCALVAPELRADPLQRKVVGMLETRQPSLDDFLLRGTLPIPANSYPTGGPNPFTILDYDGTPVFTQVEIVSRYSDDSEGADVVELLANVHRNPALATGAPARYAVTYSTSLNAIPPTEHPPVPEVVDQLLLDPDGIQVLTYDCFGNRYASHVLRPQSFDVLHHGPLQAEVRVYQTMVPEPPIPGSTLPHLFGVHAYLGWFSGRSSVELDLRFNNAQDGHDVTTPLDDPLD